MTPEDGGEVSPGVRSNVVSQSLALTRIFGIDGRTSGVTVILPYAFLNTRAGSFQAQANGASSLGFLLQTKFWRPCADADGICSFVPQTFSSFHLYVGTPLGTYNPYSPINPSTNRWTISPTVNFSYTPDRGLTWLETYFTGVYFSDNDNYLVGGAQKLTQIRYSVSRSTSAAM